ncbi:hypothetical protein Dimus_038274 [Dionaea muscipula]
MQLHSVEVLLVRYSGSSSSPGSSSSFSEQDEEFSGTWCPLEPPLMTVLDSKREEDSGALFETRYARSMRIILNTNPWECIADEFGTWSFCSTNIVVVDEHDILCCINPTGLDPDLSEHDIPFYLRAFDLVTNKWLPVEWTTPCNLHARLSHSKLLYIGNGDLCLATKERFFTRIWFVTFSVHKTTNGVVIAKQKHSSENGIFTVPFMSWVEIEEEISLVFPDFYSDVREALYQLRCSHKHFDPRNDVFNRLLSSGECRVLNFDQRDMGSILSFTTVRVLSCVDAMFGLPQTSVDS